MTETNEERIVRLETQRNANDIRWLDHVKREDEQRDELLIWMRGLDDKVDALLLREAGRAGERKEHRNLAVKVSSLVSLIVGGIISALVNAFR